MDKPNSPHNNPEVSLGLAAFNGLRAEREEWVLQAFVPPPEFELIKSMRSAIIYGQSGSGKTTIFQALVSSSFVDDRWQRLLVQWQPKILSRGVKADSLSVYEQLAHLFDDCAMALLTYLIQHPSLFPQMPGWAQETAIWFIRSYVRGEFEIRTGWLSMDLAEPGQALLSQITTWPVKEVLGPDPRPEIIITELVKTLRTLDLQGAWILVDDLEDWSVTEPEQVSAGLTAFFSALNLFERNGFTYKIFLPREQERLLAGAGSIARRRIDIYRLKWELPYLISMVEKRLTMATGGKIQTLDELCADKSLPIWLERCGAKSPRGWLQQLRPLVAAYLEQARSGKTQPISKADWKKIRQRHPPSLILDDHSRKVTVGWREVQNMPEGPFKLLQFMYQRVGEICSKSQLYYLAYRELEQEPHSPSDPNWEIPNNYEGMIDTQIWRLREAIEPSYIPKDQRTKERTFKAKDSLFIVTIRNQGYRLENAL